MINYIIKLFKEPEKIEESTVEVEIDIPKKTKAELFDEAVKEVVRSNLHKALKTSMIEACYYEQIVSDTNKAIEEYGKYELSSATVDELRVKYPRARTRKTHFSNNVVGLEFNLDNFISRILDKELEND